MNEHIPQFLESAGVAGADSNYDASRSWKGWRRCASARACTSGTRPMAPGCIILSSRSPTISRRGAGWLSRRHRCQHPRRQLDLGYRRFNVTYLIDALSNMGQEMVTVELQDTNSSALITVPDQAGFKYVVMPMRI